MFVQITWVQARILNVHPGRHGDFVWVTVGTNLKRFRKKSSVIHSLQVFLRVRIIVRQRQSSAELLRRTLSIALFLQQLAQLVVSFERRSFFHGRSQISSQ